MKLSPFYNQARDLAIAVTEGANTVFADPLFRSLFEGQELPTLPYNQKTGRLMEGKRPCLLFRRELSIRESDYALYAALPLTATEVQSPALQAELGERVMADLCGRYLLVMQGLQAANVPLSCVSVLSYFRNTVRELCEHLYAPLDVQITGDFSDFSVCVHRLGLSQAIGFALAALLCEGQSSICARLSLENGTYAISLIADRAVESKFVRELLSVLGERGGFSVSHHERGMSFLLSHAHAPEAALRSVDIADGNHLYEGFALLL